MRHQKKIINEECSFCEGTGYAFPAVFAKYESLDELACPKCNGTGWVQITIFSVIAVTRTDTALASKTRRRISVI